MSDSNNSMRNDGNPASEIDPLAQIPTDPDGPKAFDLELEEPDGVDPGSLSYRQLVWRRFRKSKLALVGAAVLMLFYLGAFFAEFIAPYDYQTDNMRMRYVPPTRIHLFDDKGMHWPFVYALASTRDPVTLESTFTEDKTQPYSVQFFHRGDAYKFLGLIRSDLHLVGSDGPFYLCGTDRMGRDLFSRILFGGRVSLTIGLVGVFLSILLGALLGTLSGYQGGAVDMVIQRVIELLSAFPSIPLWMALAAALPPGWTGIQVYFGITVVLSLLGWGGLARQVRGKILSMRDADYVLAARSAGASDWYILTRHLLPSAYSHIIISATLAIPGMILGETALSFLGLGIRPPMTSWGVLLEEAQRVTVVLHNTWLLIAAIPVAIVVIAFNFVGDALRDAADPYGG